jgi:hypothetical protein
MPNKKKCSTSNVPTGMGYQKLHLGNAGGMSVPDHVLKNLEERQSRDNRTALDLLNGVIEPGRSALEQRKPLAPPKTISAITESENPATNTIRVTRFG